MPIDLTATKCEKSKEMASECPLRSTCQKLPLVKFGADHESEQTLGDSEGQGSLVCCSPWGHKESDMT